MTEQPAFPAADTGLLTTVKALAAADPVTIAHYLRDLITAARIALQDDTSGLDNSAAANATLALADNLAAELSDAVETLQREARRGQGKGEASAAISTY